MDRAADCGGGMKTASESLRIVTHEDAEHAKKAPLRAGELIADNDPDPERLMDLLGDIDSLKLEIHERMRRIEAVKQAKSVLLEDALRTEALNKRLAEIGKVMSAAHSGVQIPEQEREESAMLRFATKTSIPEIQSQPSSQSSSLTSESESLALSWRMPEETTEEAAQNHSDLSNDPAEPDGAASMSTAATESLQESQGAIEAMVAYKMASELLEQTEDARKRADESAQEAKRLLEESILRLDQAAEREERLAADFRSAQEALNAATQTANERLAEAERYWKQTDEAAAEARRLLEQSTAELEQARKREEAIEASLQSVRNEFSTSYQSAGKRIEEAQRFWQRGDEAAQHSQQLIDQSTAELLQARSAEETAAADLVSARQELTTAYQFAAVAAQRRLDAVEFFQKATRWMIFATALSWMGMAWIAWLSFRAVVPIWGPCVATAAILGLAVAVRNLGMRKAAGD